MKRTLLKHLVCPETGLELKLTVFGQEAGEIEEGMLSAKGRSYPIIGGVPRLLPQDLLRELVVPEYPEFFRRYGKRLGKGSSRHSGELKIRTSKSFGFEWTVFSRMFPEYKENFIRYITPVKASFFKGKKVLDAGCGVGRHTYYAAEFGSEVAIGMDLSEAVVAAHENCKGFKNAHIVQADIYHPPFRKEFDYVFSIGVLHHLPSPRAAFDTLVRYIKKGGLISIWVYGFKGNFFARNVYEPIRTVTTALPHRILYRMCYVPAVIMQLANWSSGLLELIGLKSLAKRVPFHYYARFPFEVKLNDSFDVFATPKSRYYKMEEIRKWFIGLRDVKLLYLRQRSIKAFGTKP